MKSRQWSLSYANVTSTLALAIALSAGSAYAAGQLPSRSVGERALRPGAVTAEKLRKQAVTAPKIKPGAVQKGKIAGGAITSAKIADGAVVGPKLAGEVVTTDKIAGEAVTGAKVNEASLGQVPSAGFAASAAVAADANPEAFARVGFEGTVFPADSKGIDVGDVKQGKLFPGSYCIAMPFPAKGAQVTPEYAGHNQVSAYITLGGSESCQAGAAEVQTYNAGSHSKEPFFVVFYR